MWKWAVLGLAVVWSGQVMAEGFDTSACKGYGPRKDAVKSLLDKYGEVPVGMGVGEGGRSVFEIYANPETGTWTIFATMADGLSCGLANGEGWTVAPKAEKTGGKKA